MARRRRSREAPIETLFKAPWWISIIIAVMVLVVLKWLVPAAVASNAILKPMALALSGIAWVISGVFLIVGLISFAREKFSTSNTPVPPQKSQGLRDPGGIAKATLDDPQSDYGETPPASRTKPTDWSIGLLRDLEWKRFEDVCQMFYQIKGIQAATTPLGPDGGVDIRLYQDDSGNPTSIVQCKAWANRLVGVQPVRELLGVMAHEKIAKGFFMASGHFTDDAQSFAQSNPITLISGDMLLTMIQRLAPEQQKSLLAFATEGDYITPTCSSCGIKMRRVAGTNGRQDFWGCQNYPRCKQKLGVRRE